MTELSLTSSAFADGRPIPRRHTCEGEDLSPPLAWSGVPAEARSLALVCDDPDAPAGTFVHWLAWGIDPEAGGLGEGEAAPLEGRSGFGTVGYRGPCPPRSHGPHRYFFRLYALGRPLDLPAGVDRRALDRALAGRVLAAVELVGTYER